MARPTKIRYVKAMPKIERFIPLDHEIKEVVGLTVDEYETLRLIDLEKCTQAECAEKMRIARTTVQMIYTSARSKVADFIVNGKFLVIAGGDYCLYNESSSSKRNDKINWHEKRLSITKEHE
ncbi:MAG: DUF134 domain-containing protein [Huintestinicola sp.]